MKVLGISGSPRTGGNTEILVSGILEAAAKQGAAVEYIALDKLNFAGCKGCLWCQREEKGHCVQKDDMLQIYEKITAADAVILASPIYFSTIAAQLKTFIDRLYPFYGRGGKPSRLPREIKLALVITQGQPNPDLYSQSMQITADSLRLIGFNVLEETLIAPGLLNKGDVRHDGLLLSKAKLLGQSLSLDS